MRQQIAALLQIAGITFGAAAGFTVSVGLGLAVLAVGLLGMGVALELEPRDERG